MTRAALLARVSSSAQSADMQLEELRAVAKHRDWTVVLEETDTGSGARADLPGRARVLEAARRGQVDVIAVWRLDRLGRSVRDLLEISALLQRARVDLVSLRDAVETGTPSGQLLFTVLGAIAQFERELIGERVRAGIAHARANGVLVGRPRVDVDVGRALELLGDGTSLRSVAHELGVSARTLSRALDATLDAATRRDARAARRTAKRIAAEVLAEPAVRAAREAARQKPRPETHADSARKAGTGRLHLVRGEG